jgi:hypothetical protein
MSELIEYLLEQFLADSAPNYLDLLRQIATRFHVLPLLMDMGGCYAIRPCGEIISFGWDTPDDIRLEADPRIRNIALYQGSKRYPELREFIPSRPEDAIDCPTCKGKGEFPRPYDRLVCYCGGVGWLPLE